MFSRLIITNIISARWTLHWSKTSNPCGDQLVVCGQYCTSRLRIFLAAPITPVKGLVYSSCLTWTNSCPVTPLALFILPYVSVNCLKVIFRIRGSRVSFRSLVPYPDSLFLVLCSLLREWRDSTKSYALSFPLSVLINNPAVFVAVLYPRFIISAAEKSPLN
jgi:hypothetical protein